MDTEIRSAQLLLRVQWGDILRSQDWYTRHSIVALFGRWRLVCSPFDGCRYEGVGYTSARWFSPALLDWQPRLGGVDGRPVSGQGIVGQRYSNTVTS